jgi:hypothetical protein
MIRYQSGWEQPVRCLDADGSIGASRPDGARPEPMCPFLKAECPDESGPRHRSLRFPPGLSGCFPPNQVMAELYRRFPRSHRRTYVHELRVRVPRPDAEGSRSERFGAVQPKLQNHFRRGRYVRRRRDRLTPAISSGQSERPGRAGPTPRCRRARPSARARAGRSGNAGRFCLRTARTRPLARSASLRPCAMPSRAPR